PEGPRKKSFISDDEMKEQVKLMLVQRVVLERNGFKYETVEAFLRNNYTNRETRLRTSKGFNTFVIKDEDDKGEVLSGTVVAIDVDKRSLVFKTRDGDHYLMETGQSLGDAMENGRLTSSQLKAMKIKAGP